MGQALSSQTSGDRVLVPMMESPASALIQKLEAFQDLSTEDRNALSRLATTARDYPAHTDILREGEPADGVLIVVKGFACRNQFRQNGARQITAFLVPGDHCNLEAGLINRMDHAVSTLSPCRVARVNADALQAILRQHPAIRQALRMSILVNEATLREWIVNIGCRTAVERIAHLFCELHLRLNAVGLTRGMTYELPFTQNDIAVTVGLSNVHVNRSLQALRRQRLIALSGKRLTILDWATLSELAEFNPSYLQLGRRSLDG
ncbi:Crp/Fnr family transcriptional regulator [Methylobacterium sp. Leaf94]|uniref:Crp/Fnr family transcriptional regulator n=1 Tax=Methylobacterium sp. Leaf94 TaxID=1736250 RepID=UPI000A658E82|nr:Crp/Fnr family transcriptional regulator [Methylobacterium sp. Leaf94]